MPSRLEISADSLAGVRRYHRLTKHHPHRYAPGPGRLDWATQPDPFRRFEGAAPFVLPLVPGTGLRPYDALFQPAGTPQPPTIESFGLFFELALGLSAWKEFQGTRWALRNNPSSGNLHPTEGYLVLPTPVGPLEPGIFHYAPREHSLERRCGLAGMGARPGFWVGLSSIHWREAWKYGERAFRYCQHDVGHAIGSLRFAATVLGWPMRLCAASDPQIAALLGLDRGADFAGAEGEHPDLVAWVGEGEAAFPAALLEQAGGAAWTGHANALSPAHVSWPGIEQVATATRCEALAEAKPLPGTPGLPPAGLVSAAADAVSVIRSRRSAVDMDGRTSLPASAFFRMLARLDAGGVPFDAFPFPRAVAVLLFVHRVDGLAPGLYLLPRAPELGRRLREASSQTHFRWTAVDTCPVPLLELEAPADAREIAGAIACHQAIGAEGCFSLAMIADFTATLDREGAWAYRRLYWECGLIGQVLYLEAEALGVRATGIGCFFDDLDHRLLGLEPDGPWQSLYHLAVGGPVEDGRLTTLAPYGHRDH